MWVFVVECCPGGVTEIGTRHAERLGRAIHLHLLEVTSSHQILYMMQAYRARKAYLLDML